MSTVSGPDDGADAFLGADVVTMASGAGTAQPPEAFDDFYRRTYAGLLALARVLVGSGAEDVAQEAMLVAYRKWDQVGAMASPVGWVRRVCLHKAVSVRRRAQLEWRVLRRAPRPVPATDVAQQLASDDGFWSLVRGLPARQAEAVALHYALDLPVLEVADAMGCSEGSVKVHLARARTTLARVVGTDEGGRS